MADEEAAGADEGAKTIEIELAPSRKEIASLLSEFGAMKERRPEIAWELTDVIGKLEEAAVLLEDISNSYDPDRPPPPKPEI